MHIESRLGDHLALEGTVDPGLPGCSGQRGWRRRGGGGTSYSGDGSERGNGETWVLIAIVACLGILIAIAIWVISVIGRGGLIAGVQQIEEEGTTSFGAAWRASVNRFWTLFGISMLAYLPIVILAIGGLVVLAPMFIGSGLALDSSEAAGAIGLVFAILCGGIFCCGLILLFVVLDIIRTYGERAAILEGLGWIGAFRRGWEVLKANIGPTIIFGLIFLVIGLVIAAVVGGTIVLVAIPFVAVFANTDPGLWIAAPLCCGGLLAVLVLALIGSIVETFTSATWTLAYREMTGVAPPPAAES